MDFLHINMPGHARVNRKDDPIVTFVIGKITECGFKDPKPKFFCNSYVSYPPEDDPYYFFPSTVTDIYWSADFINDDPNKNLEGMIYDLLEKVCKHTRRTIVISVLDEETKKSKVSYNASFDYKTSTAVINKKVELNKK